MLLRVLAWPLVPLVEAAALHETLKTGRGLLAAGQAVKPPRPREVQCQNPQETDAVVLAITLLCGGAIHRIEGAA